MVMEGNFEFRKLAITVKYEKDGEYSCLSVEELFEITGTTTTTATTTTTTTIPTIRVYDNIDVFRKNKTALFIAKPSKMMFPSYLNGEHFS